MIEYSVGRYQTLIILVMINTLQKAHYEDHPSSRKSKSKGMQILCADLNSLIMKNLNVIRQNCKQELTPVWIANPTKTAIDLQDGENLILVIMVTMEWSNLFINQLL